MSRLRTLSLAAAFFAALSATLLSACGGDASTDRPADRYLVRGVVRQLPAAGRPGEIHVRHESIPEFKNEDGEVVGMESMTMPFPVAEPALLAGIEVGSKVEMEFEVRWDGDHPLLLTTIETLPPETRLAFEPDEAAGGGESRPP